MKDGGLEAQLGGLWLPTIELDVDRGGWVVGFDAPLRAPAESIAVQTKMGGLVFAGLGNASPAELEVEYRMGGFTFDMTGEWKRDAQIRFEGASGGGAVIIPTSVRVEGVPDLAPGATTHTETTPTLFFAPGINFDEVTVKRR